MKSFIALTLGLAFLASSALAGEKCCDKEKACGKDKAACCDEAKGECPVAKAALRKLLTTHKGNQLAKR